ncbi:protease modulator HflC [Butyrivibrio proteoclasticus]|uniref:protease modulator HflC n=1 Tax=Butyrivibrio proteoclasticus TaxID=43305 RepID=UPI00047E17D7|nr:protease modulator HflC [Butyrivibrio proteoclasticus]
MKNNFVKGLIAVIAIALFIVIGNSLFTVHQKEYVAVRQFGKIVRVENEPGLKIVTPFVQTIQRISAETKLYDIPQSDVITKDKKSMITDTYVLWRVTDPVKYIQTLNALDGRAQERIEAAVYNATKTAISSMTQDEVIESRGEALTTLITQNANSDMGGYGIEIVTAEIKSLDLPDDNRAAVYDRMISERNNIAASYEAEGAAEAQKIKNETDKKVAILTADAEKTAAQLEGEGEAEYMKILSEAYNTPEKAEFYNFMRELEAFEKALSTGDKTFILDKDSELARLLYGIY